MQFFVSLNCGFYTPTSCLFPVILHPESFPVSLNRASGAHQGMWEHLLGWPGPTERQDEEKTGEWKLVEPPRSTQRKLALGVASICRHDRGHEAGVQPFGTAVGAFQTLMLIPGSRQCAQLHPRYLRGLTTPLLITGLGARGFHFTPRTAYGTKFTGPE